MLDILPLPRAATDAWGAWDRFLAGQGGAGFHQSSWWAAAHRDPASRAFGVLVRRQGILQGGGLFLRESWDSGRAAYRIVDGPVLPAAPSLAAPAFRAVLSALHERRTRETASISHLRLEASWAELPEYVRPFGPVVRGPPRRVATIDLDATETGLLARMAPTARAHIALARRLGLRVAEDAGDRGMEDLFRLAGEGPPLTHDLSRLLPLLRRPGCGGIFFAEDRGARLAGAAVVTFGGGATLVLDGTVGMGVQAPAATFLQFELMRRLKARHCHRYHLPGPALQLPRCEALGASSRALMPPVDIVFDPAAYADFAATEPPP